MLDIVELIAEYGDDILLVDGFNEALIGVAERIDIGTVALYNIEACYRILMDRDGLDYEEAVGRFADLNVLGALSVDIECVSDYGDDILLADGFDEALIGIAKRNDIGAVALYDLNACYQVLMDRDGMDYEESAEFIDFNLLGAYVGAKTPIFTNLFETLE